MNESEPEALDIMQLQHLLSINGIPIDTWGKTNGSKTLQQLLDEVLIGETVLAPNENGELERLLHAVAVNVRYKNAIGEEFVLKEVRQEFDDGRPPRSRKLDGSLGEKIKNGENPLAAAKRGLREELQIEGHEMIEEGTIERTEFSQSYPGLKTHYIIDIFGCNITPEQYKPEGYKENQDGLTSFFEWQSVDK